MRKLNMRMWTWMATAAFALAGLPAAAGPLFKWVAEDGTVSYTDDAKRIPERYRAAAREVPSGGITGYGRYTPTRPEAQAEYAEQLSDRVARLRKLNRRLEEEAAYAQGGFAAPGVPAPGPEALVSVGDDLQVRVPSRMDDGAPIVVEDVRVLPQDSVVTTHDTVVRQGDRVLMVVRGDRHSYGPGFGNVRSLGISDYGDSDVVDEQELIGEHFLWSQD